MKVDSKLDDNGPVAKGALAVVAAPVLVGIVGVAAVDDEDDEGATRAAASTTATSTTYSRPPTTPVVTTARSRHPSWGPAPTGEPERPAAAVFGVSGFGTDAGAALVTRIVDGDTFVVQGSDRVRVLGIDSCETSTPGRVRCDDGRCTGPRARW